eukprot:TRINITY_DN24009_c0_g1_i1.p1 TRINITY_DN24009_c0_g1~~TRINITY_DN24009_c0_g1_i1.p1  ORF type:complete len:142 (+),score=31.44 TRINITY_DN24009_c0_g1_i1:1-426(+)
MLSQYWTRVRVTLFCRMWYMGDFTFRMQTAFSCWVFFIGQSRSFFFFFQAEDGIRDVERSRGLGDVYKRQDFEKITLESRKVKNNFLERIKQSTKKQIPVSYTHLTLPTILLVQISVVAVSFKKKTNDTNIATEINLEDIT